METAIRWSPHSTTSDQRFLHVDVIGRKVHLCRVTSPGLSNLTYETVTTHSRVPAFRAFDWSPANPALVALGQSSGEATVLRIDDDSEASLSFPIRSQRLCNAVALNSEGLLAAGLDKVRNDFCLNIWDLNQRVPNIAGIGTHGFSNEKGYVDPYAKLASSEPITSIKFFASQPQTLIAGVKSQYVRLYDLREAHGHSALQFPTRCVHNLAIDPLDENFMASCMPNNDPTVCVWDKRAGNRPHSAITSFSLDTGHVGPSLELKNVADVHGTIWSLRFAKTRRSCLGMLTSTGQLKTFDIGKEQTCEAERRDRDTSFGKDWKDHYPDDPFIERMQVVERPFHSKKATRKEQKRVVSFDFMTIDDRFRAPAMITLSADGQIHITAVGPGKAATRFSPFSPSLLKSRQRNETFKSEAKTSTAPSTRDKSLTGPTQTRRHHTRHSNNPMQLFRERCEKGYRFDAIKNRSIVAREKGQLQRFWKDAEHARSICNSGSLVDNQLDLSYLGIYGIWMDDGGDSQPSRSRRTNGTSRATVEQARTTESLARTMRLPALTPSPTTSYTSHRQLCLYVAGLQRTSSELESEVKKLTRHGHPTKAAALALFASEPKLATRALRQKTSGEGHKMLAMAIASSQARQKRQDTSTTDSDDSDTEWNATLSSLLTSLPPSKKDPYAHAIIQTIIHGTPAHSSVLSNPDLPLPLAYRIFIAIHHLSDKGLTSYISELTKSHVSKGVLEGVVLTGFGSYDAVTLFSNYMARTGDIQTAVLALTPVIPRYLSDRTTLRLFECWREEYRNQMQSWDLKFERVKFDIAGRKLAVSRTGEPLIRAPRPQISITCSYCQQAVTQIPPPAKPGYPPHDSLNGTDDVHNPSKTASTAPSQNPNTVQTTITTTRTPHSHPLASNRSAAIGTICPKCGRGLPRCGICEMPLGSPDPTYVKPLNSSNNKNNNNNNNRSSRDAKSTTAPTGTTTNDNGHVTQGSSVSTVVPLHLSSTSPSQTRPGSIASSSATTAAATNPLLGHKSTSSDATSTATTKPSTTHSHNTSSSNLRAISITTTNEPHELQSQQHQQDPKPNLDDLMAKFITFCVTCGHAFHARCARDWFRPPHPSPNSLSLSEVVGADVGEDGHGHGHEAAVGRGYEERKGKTQGGGEREVCPVAGCGCVCWRVSD